MTGRLPRWLSGAGYFRAMRPFTLRLARFGLGARGIVAVVMGCLLAFFVTATRRALIVATAAGRDDDADDDRGDHDNGCCQAEEGSFGLG